LCGYIYIYICIYIYARVVCVGTRVGGKKTNIGS